jgi:hypothetical protein
MTIEYTAHFRLPVPDFETEPWHEELRTTFVELDQRMFDVILTQNVTLWLNSTVYAIGDIVIGTDDGLLYICGVAHTSPALPTTFLTFRTANPTYWTKVANIPQQRGAWLTATSYQQGDFVINANRYAVCIVSHVSGVFNTDLGNGKWSILIDLTDLDVGFNEVSEELITSAATVDVGNTIATRVLINGSTGPITSLGAVPDKWRVLRFNGTPAITHHVTNLSLIGGASRVMRNGDISWMTSNNVGQWREIAFFRVDGNPASETERGVIELLTNAEAITGTDTTRSPHAASMRAAIDDRFFPAGTDLLCFNTTAPVRWTKQATHNDKAIRLVTGTPSTGGTVAFSTVFGKTATDSHTLSVAEIPSHDHGTNTGGQSVTHTHNVPALNTNQAVIASGGTFATNYGAVGATITGNASVDHTHVISAQGGSGGHTHPMDIRVQYVDAIIIRKD